MPSYYGMVFGFRIANVVWWVDHGWVAPKLLYYTPPQVDGRENVMKGTIAREIRAQRDVSPVTVPGKTDLICGNQLNL